LIVFSMFGMWVLTGPAVAASVNSAEVTCLSNCGDSAGNVTPDVTIQEGATPTIDVTLRVGNENGNIALGSGGADATPQTKYQLDLVVDGVDPVVAAGAGNFQDGTWSESTTDIDGTTQYSVAANFQPVSMSWDTDADATAQSDPSDSHWDGTKVAERTQVVAKFTFAEIGGDQAGNMEGAYINTDAQAFATPSVDTTSTNPRIALTTAGPHYESDETTVSQGFTKIHMPSGMVNNIWGGAANSQYITTYADSQVNNAPTVTDPQNAGTILEWSDYHYSSGDLEGGVDNSVDTVDAGSDISVSPDESFSFDGTGSSDEAGIKTYEWDLDDDANYEKTGSEPSHSYANEGDYTVTLRVTDNNDNTATDTLTVSVASSDDGGGGGGGGGGSGGTTTTAAPTTTTAESTTTAAPTTGATATETATSETTESTAAPTTSTDGAVDSQATTAVSSDTTTSGSGPGFGVLLSLVALVAGALLARRRV
jgi:PGF-CTERM protein